MDQRSRPESSNSAQMRMTPTSSSNSSSAHLPGRRAPSASGGASLLQERLRERKVESARQSRRRSVDLSDGDRGVQSSPVKGSGRESVSNGVAVGKGMGVKQIEEQVSTLHKQNFDLKLELYHRRQRQETLERQLETAEKQISEQAELQDMNEQLLSELEKRDQAVEEAVGMIVTLEYKVERMMKEREGVRAFEADYESTYFRPSLDDDGPPSSPPQFDDALRPKRSVPRMPSFLSEPSEGAEALRSLYLPNSESTLPKLTEESQDGTPDRMDSPRLSVLSESSFLSVYGEKQLKLSASEDEELPRRNRSSIEKWVEERPISDATPSRPLARNTAIPKSQYLSINDVLESPLQRLEKLKHTLEKANSSLVSQPERISSNKERRRSKEKLRLISKDQTSFERQHPLPPTPDTISTGTLRHFKYSNDALFQQRKASGTFLNSTSTFPSPSDLSLRPRSAGETVTSRRDGHGWDTETQEAFTETGSVSSTTSTYNNRGASFQRARTPPDLFTFNGNNDAWGRDMMFNNTSDLPTRNRYEHVRRSSMVEHPQSDDTIIQYQPSRYTGDSSPVTTISPNKDKPFPPDRRSSLSATTKLRKAAPSPTPNSPTMTNSPVTSPEKDVKKPRFSTRFFNPREKPVLGRSQSYITAIAADEEARATPPPIRRNRPEITRPSSAAGFGYDGAGEVDIDAEAKSGGKKWFGLGRHNSLKRN